MQISARNQVKGKIASLKFDGLMAEVVITIAGGQQLVSIITRSSAEALGLREGDSVTALVKSTEVMVAK